MPNFTRRRNLESKIALLNIYKLGANKVAIATLFAQMICSINLELKNYSFVIPVDTRI